LAWYDERARSVCQDNNRSSHLHSEGGFRHLGNNMRVLADDATTISEIKEAFTFLCETLQSQPNKESFMAIIDELLDARNEMAR
jgi:RNA binding exosome subunit